MQTHDVKTVVGKKLPMTDQGNEDMTTIQTPGVFRNLWNRCWRWES
jgi:hypothetical protein